MMQQDTYHLIQSLGKGGMGEVFLAEDRSCQRKVALKRIRNDLQKFKSMRQRFLSEALIAAQLNHPSIVPIYSIHRETESVYYTMPYVEGETLKQILKDAQSSDQKGAIPSLIRIFFSICQAIAYSHSKGILHRDIKPENIIVGKFGEVMLLDWGLAEYMERPHASIECEEIPVEAGLTRPGKVVGTLAYLAPERVQNAPASQQTDLYALGVILYQILTLKLPFKRGDLETFQKAWMYEELMDPIEAAPYRDIPHALNQITRKCLHPSPDLRYKKVMDLITDLEKVVEGSPEWIPIQELQMDNKDDWEFQENILLAKHMAVTRSTEVMEWVNLMISKQSFSGNMKMEALIRLRHLSNGIGFLFNVPGSSERKDLMDGYCIWLGSEKHPGFKLFRSNIEVMEIPEVSLQSEVWYTIRIEKVESHLRVYLNNLLQIHYMSHTPLDGSQIGLLLRDADLEVSHLKIFTGSQNLMVSCLAIPDAFLGSKDYQQALAQYRRIAFSFPGRTEGREALFRSGVTLLQAGMAEPKTRSAALLLSSALEEFGKLHGTAGAPLEYLGKSLVYKALGEVEEEAKCMELAIRKYPKHPLFPRLVEHVIFRLHESSSHNRIVAYHFALLSLRHLPQIFSNPNHQKLIESMKENWETIPFLSSTATAVHLAFVLAKPITLLEMIEAGSEVEDAFFALLGLGCVAMIKENPRLQEFPSFQVALLTHEKKITQILKQDISSSALQYLVFQKALDEGYAKEILPLTQEPLLRIEALLLTNQWQAARELFDTYPLEQLSQENSPLFPLFGCYLWAAEGEAIARIHFDAVSETSYPRISSLLGHFIAGRIDLKTGWIQKALFWEKVQFHRQLVLFYHCCGLPDKAATISKRLKKLKHAIY